MNGMTSYLATKSHTFSKKPLEWDFIFTHSLLTTKSRDLDVLQEQTISVLFAGEHNAIVYILGPFSFIKRV